MYAQRNNERFNKTRESIIGGTIQHMDILEGGATAVAEPRVPEEETRHKKADDAEAQARNLIAQARADRKNKQYDSARWALMKFKPATMPFFRARCGGARARGRGGARVNGCAR